jgi:gas vesicle protein
MEHTNGYSSGHIILAALGGAIAGAGIALLLAPKSGQETRDQLAGYVGTARDTVSRVPEAFRAAGHAAKEAIADPKS